MAIHLGVVNKDFGELQQLDETINSSYLQERKVSIIKREFSELKQTKKIII